MTDGLILAAALSLSSGFLEYQSALACWRVLAAAEKSVARGTGSARGRSLPELRADVDRRRLCLSLSNRIRFDAYIQGDGGGDDLLDAARILSFSGGRRYRDALRRVVDSYPGTRASEEALRRLGQR